MSADLRDASLLGEPSHQGSWTQLSNHLRGCRALQMSKVSKSSEPDFGGEDILILSLARVATGLLRGRRGWSKRLSRVTHGYMSLSDPSYLDFFQFIFQVSCSVLPLSQTLLFFLLSYFGTPSSSLFPQDQGRTCPSPFLGCLP